MSSTGRLGETFNISGQPSVLVTVWDMMADSGYPFAQVNAVLVGCIVGWGCRTVR